MNNVPNFGDRLETAAAAKAGAQWPMNIRYTPAFLPLWLSILDPAIRERHCIIIMADANPNIAEMTFEDALRALEDVVRRLESGEVPLDDSINLYEQGEKLRQHCQARLDAAQAKIEKIVQAPDGRAVGTAPFDTDA